MKDVSGIFQFMLDLSPSRKGQRQLSAGSNLLQRFLINKIPSGSWDSHMHVVSAGSWEPIPLTNTVYHADYMETYTDMGCNFQIDPVKYPLAKGALYNPKSHLLPEAIQIEASVGIRNIVLVQPSIYETDNSCLLEALQALGPRYGRAVVAFDYETIDPSTLETWHQWGVRGVRVNTQSIRKHMSDDELATTLRRYADVIRPYNWVLQLYVPLATATVLEKIVPELGVIVCLDHFGSPDLSEHSYNGDPYNLPGFRSLVNLLLQGNTYVKLSAPYRISRDKEWKDLEPVAKELLKVAGMHRTIFASDWPHTRFEGLDIKPYMETLLEWCGHDEVLIERVFKGNAETLWGIEP
ncbi:TIM barrel metal-dependent hydrolase [Aspergillus sclerotialis]|uniref:TIM barrel metal-dependent hydrolase n=1 Tax=Aspergillus sclerotialis TaxID=2070753 RepID=A0A3A2ZQD1_9EURO|nr:TIM barrel metal-dependent hydrolase [Aspergillus sclerotialis]